MTSAPNQAAAEAAEDALALVVGQDAWDCACRAYAFAKRDGRPHADALRQALHAAQQAAAGVLAERAGVAA